MFPGRKKNYKFQAQLESRSFTRNRTSQLRGKSLVKCRIEEDCGSCAFINRSLDFCLQEKHEAGLKVLEQSNALKKAQIISPIPSPKGFDYRTHFKLAVRRESAFFADTGGPEFQWKIGLYKPGTHKIVDVSDCPLHAPVLRHLLFSLKRALAESNLTSYDERKQTGDLRYLVVRSSHLTDEIMIIFVVTRPLKNELKEIVLKLRQAEFKVNSAHMNLNASSGNAIMGKETIKIAGSDKLRERLCGLDLEISPGSFFQVNPWQAQNLYHRIEQIVGQTARLGREDTASALDLYCGIGVISLLLGKSGYRVLGVEESPISIMDAEENAKRNHLEKEVVFQSGLVEDLITMVPNWAKKPKVIVVNPSRRGLEKKCAGYLAKLLLDLEDCRLLYVSCNVETLARDLEILTSTGYRVRQIEAFDMFPNTDKLEWLTVLTR